MRDLDRNKRTIYYALYKSESADIDAHGDETGGYSITYDTSVSIKVNVSAARGTSETEQFGVDLKYTKTFVTTDMTCPIAEDSVLWVDDVNTSHPYDYTVASIAKSINSITYAIRKVDVS